MRCAWSGASASRRRCRWRARWRTRPSRGRLHVEHSVSELAQAVALDEWRDLAARHPHISYRIRTTGTQGRLGAAEVLALVQAHPAATFFLCGSAGYMAAMAAHLSAAGVAADRIRQEHFRVAGEQPAPEVLALTAPGRPCARAEPSRTFP